MPRRIPDYPDAYAQWNYLSSIGSTISIAATVLFIYICYDIFANAKSSEQNIAENSLMSNISTVSSEIATLPENKELSWAQPGYMVGNMEFRNYPRFSNTLEWSLPTPTPLHAYETLPAQTYSV